MSEGRVGWEAELVSLVRAVLFEVPWNAGVDLESAVSAERWQLRT